VNAGVPKQTEWDTYYNWHAEASRRLQNSETASLRDSLQKGNEKPKTEAVPKTKDRLTAGTPATLLFYTQVLVVFVLYLDGLPPARDMSVRGGSPYGA